MKYKARFLYDIYLTKYAIIPYYSWGNDDNWTLHKSYAGMSYAPGYRQNHPMLYMRRVEKDVVLYEEEIGIEFEIKNKIRINEEVVTIIDIIKNLDGSIDYYTDKVVYRPLNSRETYFDETPKEKEK